MYIHSPNSKGGRSINIPYNYGGNAFRSESAPETKIHKAAHQQHSAPTKHPRDTFDAEESEDIISEPFEKEYLDDEAADTQSVSALPCAEHGADKRNELGSLGKLLGGIGSEELLLLAILLMISQGEKNDDLSLMLLLLLFIK